MRAKGIDISKYQNKFVYQNNIDFIIVKATEGWGVDKYFLSNLPEVGKVKRRGVYHYYRTATDPIVQADNFLTYAQRGDFHFLAVDYEATNNVLDKAGAENYLKCLHYLQANQDLPVIMYTGSYIYRDNLRHWFAEFDDFQLWLSRYSGQDPEISDPTSIVNRDWTLWQFTSKGDGPQYGTVKVDDSYTSYVDMNVFNGTGADMDAWLGIGEEDCCADLKRYIDDMEADYHQIHRMHMERITALENRVTELEKRPWWMRWF